MKTEKAQQPKHLVFYYTLQHGRGLHKHLTSLFNILYVNLLLHIIFFHDREKEKERD